MFTPWQRQKRARIEYQRYVIIDRWDTKECLTCFTSATIAPRSPTAAAHCRLQELAATTSTTSITATYKTCRDSMPVTVERLKEGIIKAFHVPAMLRALSQQGCYYHYFRCRCWRCCYQRSFWCYRFYWQRKSHCCGGACGEVLLSLELVGLGQLAGHFSSRRSPAKVLHRLQLSRFELRIHFHFLRCCRHHLRLHLLPLRLPRQHCLATAFFLFTRMTCRLWWHR